MGAMAPRRYARPVVVGPLILATLLNGCVALPRRAAVPTAAATLAIPAGCPDARFWPDLGLDRLYQDAARSDDRERKILAAAGRDPEHLPPADYLAISGGGDNGAFGAGVLVGWTASGTRPSFKVVTGVSAGALIAPFAFLGPDYDPVLQQVSQSISPQDVFHLRPVAAVLGGPAFADDAPLAALIERHVTTQVIDAVAQEYDRGRVLLIGTADLDSGQPVVWNMGAIAQCRSPAAASLFRQVLLASASVPGVFPPVMVDVAVNGTPYQEMHADGSVVSQLFLFPASFMGVLTQGRTVNARDRHVYAIRNGRIEPTQDTVPRRMTSVAHRSLFMLTDAQGINDLYRLQTVARQDNERFSVAYIAPDFTYPHQGFFASDYLQHLFAYAYQRARSGEAWKTSLPGAGNESGPR